MKTNYSSYILVAEIITIILFHAVKIRQTEKHPADLVFARGGSKNISLHQPITASKSGVAYLLLNLVK